MSGDAQMNVLQPHKWPAIADSGFWQGYYQQAIFHLLTHLLPHHPLPSSKCCCCCCCGGDCSLYVGADEILRASGELFKREDYESSFLARCWRVWIDMSPPQPQPQPFLSFFFFFLPLLPLKPRTLWTEVQTHGQGAVAAWTARCTVPHEIQ